MDKEYKIDSKGIVWVKLINDSDSMNSTHLTIEEIIEMAEELKNGTSTV